ncbi:non-heme iron oxygenase ferredoxin subunit [Maribrevibacterium harenarium]|uniref:Non-heme iron oxygenase ferredoxin subunit n=1 Tax=Maribrevibacterium harenarium TaxID=2589817 RepID=A0A501WA59_9GAMM|nr:non-heme iron oxygenase ferredoxin subunit [Maribrevibacterium harenarium]
MLIVKIYRHFGKTIKGGYLSDWIPICPLADIPLVGAKRFDHKGESYAIFRQSETALFATSGYCTHQRVHLADGEFDGDIITCPKHQGSFAVKSGCALGAPVFKDLQTFAVKLEDGMVYVKLPL